MKRRRTKLNGNLNQITANIDLTQVREEQLNGRTHLVAPVVMAVEGVMNGYLYPADELVKFTQAWNGRPVTLFHPKDEAGTFISANSPQVLERVQLGQVHNSDAEDVKLKGEIWVDVEKTKAVRPEVLEYFGGGKDKLEVSTGLWGDILQVPGTFNGIEYKGIMTNIRPDHLALLPGGQGACSWDDGCGLRANGDEPDKYKERQDRLEANITDRELRKSIQIALDAMDVRSSTMQSSNYVEEIDLTKKQFIYEQSTRTIDPNGNTMGYEDKLYRRSYTLENGEAKLGDDAVEVRRVVKYEEVKANQSEGATKTMTKEAKVNALIACQRCKYEEKDREFLMGLNEEQLELISPPDNVIVKSEDPPPATNHKEDPKPEGSEREPHGNVVSPQDYIANSDMPAEIKDTLAESLAYRAFMRNELIETISKSPKNKFAVNRLQVMSTEDLKNLAALAEQTEAPKPESQPNFGMRVFGNTEPEDKGPEPLQVQSLTELFSNKSK